MTIFRPDHNHDAYFRVWYHVKSKTTLRDAAWQIAIGQSVGNPNVRNRWESDQLFEDHSCLVLHDESELKAKCEGLLLIAFPVANIDFRTDGIAHLLVNIMGGQMDIDIIEKCQVLNIDFPKSVTDCFHGPKYGIKGIRAYTDVYDKPLLGAIVKPKTGIRPDTLLDMVKELVDGGVNFIKEDEILSNPAFCRIKDRVPKIMQFLDGKGVVYSVSIHSDPAHLLDRVRDVWRMGGNSVHVNFWCGLGVYKSIRDMDLPIMLHFQKSGDKILTNRNHNFYIAWPVICQLAALSGVDFIHAGMLGGYYKWPEDETKDSLEVLHKYGVMPALSCGFHPGLTDWVTKQVGVDYMANVGGAIHGHPDGTTAGAKAMRQSIDGQFGPEYFKALDTWGIR